MDKKEIHPQLQSFEPIKYSNKIERIWLGKEASAATEFFIPPTQYIDLIFPLSGSILHRNEVKYTSPILEGIMFQPVKFKIQGAVLGVRFRGFGWYPFSSMSGCDTFNKVLIMDFPNSEESEIKAVCTSKSTEEAMFHIFRTLDLLYDEQKDALIEIVKHYYYHLVDEDTPLSLKEYCDLNSFNYNTLNRAFQTVMGMSTKKFSRLINFRKAFDKLIKTNLSLTEIALDSGYFDQPHFVREFKYFCGYSPSDFRKYVNSKDSFLDQSNKDFSSF